jgi:hypothetical protein
MSGTQEHNNSRFEECTAPNSRNTGYTSIFTYDISSQYAVDYCLIPSKFSTFSVSQSSSRQMRRIRLCNFKNWVGDNELIFTPDTATTGLCAHQNDFIVIVGKNGGDDM